MFESLAYTFMFTKVRDNIKEYNFAVTYWLLISYSGAHFLFNLCTCRKLYDYNNVGSYYNGPGRKLGAFVNLLLFGGLAVIVVVFRIKTWDFYLISKDLTVCIFVLGGIYAGLIHLLL